MTKFPENNWKFSICSQLSETTDFSANSLIQEIVLLRMILSFLEIFKDIHDWTWKMCVVKYWKYWFWVVWTFKIQVSMSGWYNVLHHARRKWKIRTGFTAQGTAQEKRKWYSQPISEFQGEENFNLVHIKRTMSYGPYYMGHIMWTV